MTANKILNIGKASFKVSWALVVFIVTAVFVIIVGFFKLWGFLDDGKNDQAESHKKSLLPGSYGSDYDSERARNLGQEVVWKDDR